MRTILTLLLLTFSLTNVASSVEMNLMNERTAWEAPGYMWVHITDRPYCDPCNRASGFRKAAAVVNTSRAFNCVELCWCDEALQPRIKQYQRLVGQYKFPIDIIVHPDRKTMQPFVGCPNTEMEYQLRIENYISDKLANKSAPLKAVNQPMTMVCDGTSCWLVPQEKRAAWPSYPSTSLGRYWQQDGHLPTRNHLSQVHGFDYQWLLTLSQQQLNALHSDAHNGRLRRDSVVWAKPTGHWEVRTYKVCDRRGSCVNVERRVWVP